MTYVTLWRRGSQHRWTVEILHPDWKLMRYRERRQEQDQSVTWSRNEGNMKFDRGWHDGNEDEGMMKCWLLHTNYRATKLPYYRGQIGYSVGQNYNIRDTASNFVRPTTDCCNTTGKFNPNIQPTYLLEMCDPIAYWTRHKSHSWDKITISTHNKYPCNKNSALFGPTRPWWSFLTCMGLIATSPCTSCLKANSM